jgi:acyl carrier protein
MDNKAIQSGIIECLKNIGIFVDDADNFELPEYIDDSVSFLTFIVELERKFEVEIPDNYLSMKELNTLSDVYDLVNMIMGEADVKL